MDHEEPWIEDGEDSESENHSEQNAMGLNLFEDPDPFHDVELTFGKVTLKVSGKLRVKYPHLLESTGLTLWDGSKNLCNYLSTHREYVEGKNILELGAGMGVCGILAHKLGAKKVILTDGDTATLANMRINIAANQVGLSEDDSIICKQLRWGRKLDVFQNDFTEHFDTIMGGDIVYAQGALSPLFETVSKLLPKTPNAVFLQSYINRNGVQVADFLQVAESHGLDWFQPYFEGTDGVYVFHWKNNNGTGI